jgi:hypothetical protein
MAAGRASSGNGLGGVAVGADCAWLLRRVRPSLCGVQGTSRDHKRHPSVRGVLPAWSERPIVATAGPELLSGVPTRFVSRPRSIDNPWRGSWHVIGPDVVGATWGFEVEPARDGVLMRPGVSRDGCPNSHDVCCYGFAGYLIAADPAALGLLALRASTAARGDSGDARRGCCNDDERRSYGPRGGREPVLTVQHEAVDQFPELHVMLAVMRRRTRAERRAR